MLSVPPEALAVCSQASQAGASEVRLDGVNLLSRFHAQDPTVSGALRGYFGGWRSCRTWQGERSLLVVSADSRKGHCIIILSWKAFHGKVWFFQIRIPVPMYIHDHGTDIAVIDEWRIPSAEA